MLSDHIEKLMMFLKHEATQKAKAHEQQRRLQKELELVKVILPWYPRFPYVAVEALRYISLDEELLSLSAQASERRQEQANTIPTQVCVITSNQRQPARWSGASHTASACLIM